MGNNEREKFVKLMGREMEENLAKYPAKHINESFQLIDVINGIEACHLSIPSIKKESYNAIFTKKDVKGFNVSFEGINEFARFITEENWLDTDIVLSSNDTQLKLTHVHVTGTGNQFKLTRAENEEYFTGSLNVNMHVGGFILKPHEQSFYRQVIKIDSFDITRFLKTEPYTLVDLSFGDGFFRFLIDNVPYGIFVVKIGGQKYLVIDSEEKVDYEKFSSHSYSVCVALGFITCNFFQTECWYLECDNEDFKEIKNISYRELRNSLSSYYNPIHQNPYGYFNGTLPDTIPKNLTVIESPVFSQLCSEISTNDKLLGALIIFMEGHKLSVYSRGASYSVTLEMLTQMIADKNAGFKPIVNDTLSKKMISDMRQVLDKYKTQINDPTINAKEDFIESVKILEKKIDGLNSPTNKDKLSIPFQLYKIDIVSGSQEDKAISHRNSFLHGTDLRKSKHDYLSDYEVWEVTLHLCNMINKLILKYVGYEGYVINHAEFQLNKEGLNPEVLFPKI